jgi:hypothetical protein
MEVPKGSLTDQDNSRNSDEIRAGKVTHQGSDRSGLKKPSALAAP